MKRAIFFIFTALGFFILFSLIILPEYRLRTIVLLLVYLVVYYLLFKTMVKEHLSAILGRMFPKRFKLFVVSMIIFISVLLFVYFVLDTKIIKRQVYWVTHSSSMSLTHEQKEYLERYITDNYEVIYIKPTKGQDNSALFNSIMQELVLYAHNVRYSVIHPVAQPDKYSQIKSKAPSLLHGNVFISMGDRYVIVDAVSPYEVLNGLYRVKSGLSNICLLQGHGEASIDDFSEYGAGLIAEMLRDKGLVLVRSDFNYIDLCPATVIIDPKKEFSGTEIKKLDDYTGSLVIIGGAELSSLRKFLSLKGINISKEKIYQVDQSVLRDYYGGLLLDIVKEHPATIYMKNPAVVAYAYSLNCSDCQTPLMTSSGKVLALKKGLSVFTGSALCSNFFIRFKGNAQLLFGILNNACCGGSAFIPPDSEQGAPKLFAISPRFLSMIFLTVVLILPFLFLLLGIYCFRSNRG